MSAALGVAPHHPPARSDAAPASTDRPAASIAHKTQGRIVALDGLRGLMTLFVLVSHYFGEVAHGTSALEVGWIAVQMFFVLSGFLVGRLILDKQHHANFFFVFYMRRCCRTLPVYIFCVIAVFATIKLLGHQPYLDITAEFPLWSYLTFTQNVFMVHASAIGPHWLAPTWTLSVEEQFYLLAPALFVLLPRRALLPVFAAGAFACVAFRAAVFWGGVMPEWAALVYLPGCMDSLFCGLIAGVAYACYDLTKYTTALRVLPLVALVCLMPLKLLDGAGLHLFDILGRFIVSIACTCYILAVVLDAPEAQRLKSPILGFFGTTSYAVYLTHLAVLGTLHGLILGSAPDVASPAQLAVTVAALPVAILVGWLITKIVEEPITAYGRSFAWSKASRRQPAA